MNDMVFQVNADVISDMTSYEKGELANELAALMQNQNARVEVAQERGFPYLWRILTGKQGKLQSQILLDQAQINQIMQKLLLQLWQGQAEHSNDINELNQRMVYLEKVVSLHSMYLLRLEQRVGAMDGVYMDVQPLKTHLDEMMREETTIMKRIRSLPTPAPKPEYRIVAELCESLFRSGEDIEQFLRHARFSNPNWPLKVMDAGVFWTTIFKVDGWQIQQWDGDSEHYRILDPQRIRRAWTSKKGEMYTVLLNYQELLMIRG